MASVKQGRLWVRLLATLRVLHTQPYQTCVQKSLRQRGGFLETRSILLLAGMRKYNLLLKPTVDAGNTSGDDWNKSRDMPPVR